VFRDGRAVDYHEGLARPAAESMNGPRRQVLASARFTRDEHGEISLGHHLDGFINPLHGAASAYQILKRRFVLDTTLQPQVFPQQVAAFERLSEGEHQVVMVEGLGDEIVGPRFDRFHGEFDAAVGGHQDHGKPGVFLAELFQEFQTIHVGHLDIGQHQVNGSFPDEINGGPSRQGGLHRAVQLGFEGSFEQQQEILFIVDGQEGFFHDG